MTERVTALMAQQADNRMRYAMDRLLHRLRKFVEAHPMREDYSMPPYDIAWITYLEDGPERAILDAIKASPELWRPLLPEEVCIVPKGMLEELVGAADLHALEGYGAMMISQAASKALYEQSDKEMSEYRP